MRSFLTLAASALALAGAASAQDMVVLADKLFTGDAVIDDAAVLIEDGRISGVGMADDMEWDDDAEVMEVAVATPGFIDGRTVVGINGQYNIDADQDADEDTDPNGAELRVIDAYNPYEELIPYVRRHGVTTMHVTPGDVNPIAGQSAVVKTGGDILDDALISPSVGVLFNLGETPKAVYGGKGGPSTRMATASMIRAQLHGAKAWADKEDAGVDLEKQALADVLSGDKKAIFAAHRSDDIMTALRIGAEFGFTPVIAYGTEAYLIADTLAEQDVTVLVTPVLGRAAGRNETLNASLENAAILHDAGVNIVFATHQEGYVPKTRVLLWEAAIAVANGLPDEAAISAMTTAPAEMLGISDETGSIAEGKSADLVLFDGDPFEYVSHVEAVMLGGEVVHQREE
ncbi:amidohydrolase family protein [Parvularcula sp. ZS-1/3]|uniref:Amidohydrolase family protein n=1 Tax=Parvularcula mediterranea TaxID=2732508 RepID=A0A7Y3W3P8_9PROT|nr:amidohydrolase family protein [Parvularcula mediterranea]NNU14975.1 amidohydrolase family protein [Parvularcula mediterranea]